MKNVLWKRFYAVMAFVSLVAAGSLTACSDNEDGYDSGVTGLTVPQELLSEGITVARSGGTTTFAVQSLEAVQVSSSETWCTVQASAPSATLKAVTVTVTVQENTDVNDRTAIITLAAGSSSQQVSVKQTAADGLLVEAPAPVAAEGGTLEIALTTNGEPEVTCSVDWIARVQTKANMAERTYTFTVDKNESYSATDRIGRITFTLGTLTETVDVVQKPGRTYDWVGMNSDAVTLAKQMYAGINIGNTMEVPGGETGWGNPRVSKEYIDGLKAAGFNAVRIPCAWDSHIINQETNEIDPAWLDRVSEVVGYCRDNEMYAIVNIHWDGGWLEDHILGGINDAINQKQHDLWTQIANKLNVYDEYLLFAGCNEPGMNETSAAGVVEPEDIRTIMAYEQTFVDAVRATGGNNATRCLIVQTPSTRISDAVSGTFDVPQDEATGRLLVEAHFYEPYNFCLMEEDASWGNTFWYWGAPNHVEGSEHNPTWGEEDHVLSQFELLKTHFADRGIPCIIGEYNAMARTVSENQAAHDASRAYWNEVVTREAKNHGIVPFHWETGSEVDRHTGNVTDPGVISGIMQGAAEGVYPF